MIFQSHYCIRWHDTDAKRRITPTHLLMYMEETSNAHLNACGMSFDALRDKKQLAFLLSRITMRIYRTLTVGDEIDVETWVCESRGLSFLRCYRVRCGGEVAAEAYSIWALLDLNTRKLLPACEFPYDIEPEAPLGAALSARVRYPALDLMEEVGKRNIVYSDIDYNWHMNNTHYPNMLCDFTPDVYQKRVVGITMSFVHEAAFGHTLRVYRLTRDEGCYFRTVDEDGTVCLEALVQTEPEDETAAPI